MDNLYFLTKYKPLEPMTFKLEPESTKHLIVSWPTKISKYGRLSPDKEENKGESVIEIGFGILFIDFLHRISFDIVLLLPAVCLCEMFRGLTFLDEGRKQLLPEG